MYVLLGLAHLAVALGNPLVLRYTIALLNKTNSPPEGYSSFQSTLPFEYVMAASLFVGQFVEILIQSQHRLITRAISVKSVTSTRMFIAKRFLQTRPGTVPQARLIQTFDRDTHAFTGVFFYLRWLFHKVSICLFSIVICFYLVGLPALMGLGVFILTILSSVIVGKILVKRNHSVLDMNEKRIHWLTEFLNGIKSIKFHALESNFYSKIMDFRKNESHHFFVYTTLEAVGRLIVDLGQPILVIGVILLYLLQNRVLDPSIIFPVLIYVQMIIFQLGSLDNVVTQLYVAHDALDRMVEFIQAFPSTLAKPLKVEQTPFVHVQNAVFNFGGLKNGDKAEKETNSDSESKFELNIEELKIQQGATVAIVGEVGSGKSTLLEGLLGFLNLESGNVDMAGSIAYCPQEPWIMSGTVKDNILFGRPSNEETMTRVIQACGLIANLNEFPDGLETMIGEKGINLSGGQKARVALARAIYSEADIVLLDCPLSALDTRVAKHVWREAIIKLLKNKLVVMVTHNISLLDEVDQIVVM
jgi:ABC-type multidrug transport system fused ATPase/permease subunit